jgi:hypothetical protein
MVIYRGVPIVELLALHGILANAVMMLHWEEAALVAPWCLLDARGEAPVPELTDRAKAFCLLLHLGHGLVYHLYIDPLRSVANGDANH